MTQEDTKAFRSINKYINYNTGEEYLEYGRIYDSTGPARSYATQIRKDKKQFKSVVSDRFEYFEFAETWCEFASEWRRV